MTFNTRDPGDPAGVDVGDVVLGPARRTVRRAGEPVELTRKEFGVLGVLLSAGGAAISSEELLERVWDEYADPFTTTVRVTVMTSRKELGEPAINRHRDRLRLASFGGRITRERAPGHGQGTSDVGQGQLNLFR